MAGARGVLFVHFLLMVSTFGGTAASAEKAPSARQDAGAVLLPPASAALGRGFDQLERRRRLPDRKIHDQLEAVRRTARE